ncbi:MAG TPA: L,D-transpeptidase [Candidatus Dojkabacteria bacterium]|nr:L,D-transpeptidase [Candidatus Dojkabacteria bacterium]
MKKITYLLVVLTFVESVVLGLLNLPSKKQQSNSVLGCMPQNSRQELSEQYDSSETSGEFLGYKVTVPALFDSFAYVLGESVGAKRIEVNLQLQHVYGFDGNSKLFDFVVSTGKWAPTPKGNFTIERKIRAQKMSGGSKERNTYYYLPNVPWVMFYGNSQIPWYKGYSFHGAYWHNNFGQPMSHGCVNMKIPEAEQLFNWAPIGTPVIIY